ncbi:HAD family phosphatase [Cellulomonas sp. NPDC089187]|uniref:HAD family hydrolase n=1 Tax=Cellulomonas sp. NPDC089187 TaxID=3154970 RepID=UPI00344A7B06
MTAVLFDLGNVLVRWDARAAFAGAYTDAEVEKFMTAVDFPALNLAQDAGRPWSQARDGIVDRRHRAMLDHYVAHFPAALPGPVPGSAAVVDELIAAGVPVYGLTNWSAETFHHAVPAAPVIGRLAGVVVSGQEGMVKPDPRIFQLTAQRFALVPEQTVFVDDSPGNVAAARNEGFDGVVFTGASALRAELARRGLLA